MDIFIIPDPETKTEWQLDPAYLANQLSVHWPNIEIKYISIPESIYLLDWELNVNNQNIGDGSLHKNRQTVVFSGSLEYVVEFILWYRSIVPEQQQLLLFDDSNSINFSVTPNISREEILKSI